MYHARVHPHCYHWHPWRVGWRQMRFGRVREQGAKRCWAPHPFPHFSSAHWCQHSLYWVQWNIQWTNSFFKIVRSEMIFSSCGAFLWVAAQLSQIDYRHTETLTICQEVCPTEKNYQWSTQKCKMSLLPPFPSSLSLLERSAVSGIGQLVVGFE